MNVMHIVNLSNTAEFSRVSNTAKLVPVVLYCFYTPSLWDGLRGSCKRGRERERGGEKGRHGGERERGKEREGENGREGERKGGRGERGREGKRERERKREGEGREREGERDKERGREKENVRLDVTGLLYPTSSTVCSHITGCSLQLTASHGMF